jgi:starch synthase (maltosyl-transferring)
MKQPEKMIIYNLFPLLAGKFADWEGHLSRAAEMGFNWVFVNPIQRPGSSGSLYSITDYYDFNPQLVDRNSKKKSAEQAKDMIDTAERMGLKMMVDLVINHCSVDSELLRHHPAWFLWKDKGHVEHPFCNENGKKVVWRDLAKFDHRNSKDAEGLFQFFFDVVKFLAKLGFKGFRCDAAYQIPSALWKRLINETKKMFPQVLFIAETLGCPPDQTRKTASAGFDYVFNSSKWWDFQGHWLMEQYGITRDIAPSISFAESHDTVRLCEELKGNIQGLKQRYLFSALFSAGVMMPIGFEFGFTKRLHVVKTRPEDWEETDIDLTAFIKKVNTIKSQHPVFQEEAVTEILHHGYPHVLLMWKASVTTQEEALLILNKDVANQQHFYSKNLGEYVQAGAPLTDSSPEHTLEYIPTPFPYDLWPGEGLVFITSRDSFQED